MKHHQPAMIGLSCHQWDNYAQVLDLSAVLTELILEMKIAAP